MGASHDASPPSVPFSHRRRAATSSSSEYDDELRNSSGLDAGYVTPGRPDIPFMPSSSSNSAAGHSINSPASSVLPMKRAHQDDDQSRSPSSTATKSIGAAHASVRPSKKPRTTAVAQGAEEPSPRALSNHSGGTIKGNRADLPFFDLDLEEGEISPIPEEQQPIIAAAMRQNLIVVMKKDFDEMPVLFMNAFIHLQNRREDSIITRRPCLFIIPPGSLDRLLGWTDVLATHCKAQVGILDALPSDRKDPADTWNALMPNEVILCAADAFLQALSDGLLLMSDFCLVVVDKIDLAVACDAYRDIFLKHLRDITAEQRPNILGLTMKPFADPANFSSEVQMIEELVKGRVWGVSDEVRNKVNKNMQLLLPYDPSPFKTNKPSSLHQSLHALDPEELVFKKAFRSSEFLLTELGPYAADIFWQRVAITQEMRRNAMVKEKSLAASFSKVEEMRSELVRLVRAYEFPQLVLDPKNPNCNVTPKLITLINVLQGIVAKEKNFRGVIFVNKRTTATALTDFLNKNPQVLPNVKAASLIGVGLAVLDPHADHLSKHQAATRFQDGTVNLLIMTGVGYDLEVDRCSIAIQFDATEGQPATELQQSPARKSAKIFLVLAEKGKEKKVKITAPRPSQRRAASVFSPHSSRGADETADSDDDRDDRPCIKIPETNSRIYPEDAPQVLTRYVSIQEKASIPLKVEYRSPNGNDRLFICTIHFPPSADLNDVTSEPCPSKATARRQASYLACEELQRRDLLGQLVAQAKKKLKTLTKAKPTSVLDNEAGFAEESRLAKERKKKARGSKIYTRKTPSVWTASLSLPSSILYPVAIQFHLGSNALPTSYRTMCLLTRLRLPSLPSFELFFPELNESASQEVAASITVQLVPCAPFQVPPDRMTAITRFTTRLVRCSTSKKYVCPQDQIVYYFLPLKLESQLPGVAHNQSSAETNIDEHVDWEEVENGASETAYFRLNRNNLEQEVADSIVQDIATEFTRKYEVLRVRRDLNPLSKPDDGSREMAYDSILDFCRAQLRGFQGIEDESQPLLEVRKAPSPLNRLSPSCESLSPSRKLPAKYLIPEICVKYCLSLSSYCTAMTLPSIMARIDELLLAQEYNRVELNNRVNEGLVLQALTSPAAGADYDYQRLELLGDAFLKYSASIFLFVTHPTASESSMHEMRQRIVSNLALNFHSIRLGTLPPYIQARKHFPRQWWPPNFRLYRPGMERALRPEELFQTGESAVEEAVLTAAPSATQVEAQSSLLVSKMSTSNTPEDPMAFTEQELTALREQQHQELGDKCIADVAEALVGAGWLTGQRETALHVCHVLGLPMGLMGSWDFLRQNAPQFFGEGVVLEHRYYANVRAVEAILGHKFKIPFLAAQALTHPSGSTSELPGYDRLEFIGDAIIEFLTVRMVFTRWGELSEGSLTVLKGAMVSNAALAALCVELGLHNYIIHESRHLSAAVSTYVKELAKAKVEHEVAAASAGQMSGEYWVGLEPPKVLSDIIESLLGAIYLSDSFDPTGYESVYDRLIKPFFLRRVSPNTLAQHPTKLLHEALQARHCRRWETIKSKAETKLLTEVQVDIKVHRQVLASAIAGSQAAASRKVASLALARLKAEPGLLDKLCDCPKPKTHKSEKAVVAEERDHQEE